MTHVHLIGIGGTGISSIARVLLEKGYTVSGSDRALSPLALELQKAGATVYEGHASGNIEGADLIVRSSAIPDENIEVVTARSRGIPIQKRSDFLNSLLREYRVLAVAGSHGKTTSSTMLAWTSRKWAYSPVLSLAGYPKHGHERARRGRQVFCRRSR